MNHGLAGDDMIVSAAFVGEGPTLKRWRPRARGRASRINKRTCHITVMLAQPDGGVLPIRKVAPVPAPSTAPEPVEEPQAEEAAEKPKRAAKPKAETETTEKAKPKRAAKPKADAAPAEEKPKPKRAPRRKKTETDEGSNS